MSGHPPDHELAEPDRSLGELVGRSTSDGGDLVTAHIDLARTEIKQEVADAGKGAGMLGGGAIAALVAVVMLSAVEPQLQRAAGDAVIHEATQAAAQIREAATTDGGTA